ncbi:MAG: putative membrane protein [Oleiphilaceae bacterium]|jgi:putative membrane protein
MNLVALVFSTLTIVIHVLVFVGESLLWGNPLIIERVLSKIDAPAGISLSDQAQILEVLFYNQGFYNLFVALGGVGGLILYKYGRIQEGIVLVCYMCLFALGAGVVLASTTTAYPAAVIQGLPPLIALAGLYYGNRQHAST